MTQRIRTGVQVSDRSLGWPGGTGPERGGHVEGGLGGDMDTVGVGGRGGTGHPEGPQGHVGP